jgi:hypothetical protein
MRSVLSHACQAETKSPDLAAAAGIQRPDTDIATALFRFMPVCVKRHRTVGQ